LLGIPKAIERQKKAILNLRAFVLWIAIWTVYTFPSSIFSISFSLKVVLILRVETK
jgi:hypothetical protein